MAISHFLAVSSVFFRELPVRESRHGVAVLFGRTGWRGSSGKGPGAHGPSGWYSWTSMGYSQAGHTDPHVGARGPSLRAF